MGSTVAEQLVEILEQADVRRIYGVFHPGDAFTLPGHPTEVLAVPVGAPWLKVSESIDYLREVGPRVAVPVHEQTLSAVGTSLYYRQLEQLGARGGTALRVLDDRKPLEL
jgi:hypothetical protein